MILVSAMHSSVFLKFAQSVLVANATDYRSILFFREQLGSHVTIQKLDTTFPLYQTEDSERGSERFLCNCSLFANLSFPMK